MMAVVWKVVAFFGTKAGMYVVIASLVGAGMIGLRQQGYNSAERKCVAAAKQREIEIKNRDAKIGELSSKLDARIGAEQEKDRKTDDEFQAKLEAELAKRSPTASCLLTEPDRLKLR